MGPYPADSTPPAASTTLEDSPSSRSFFARLGLPLRSRSARSIADFHISPEEPHRKYTAGDHVYGAVVLTVVKPISITHLTVTLHGFVRVFKGSNSSNDSVINPADIPTGNSNQFKYNGNGRASLFSDEQVLSSSGVLKPGRYEFKFELVFPEKGLPSSIDFERGTISYMVTATLTRPGTTSPITACERKVHLVEQVDVGPLDPPRPRTIYLEPIPKRSRRRRQAPVEKSLTASDPLEPASDLDSIRANENSTEGSLSVAADDPNHDGQLNTRSPIHSDVRSVSGESAVSGSTGLSRGGDVYHGPGSNPSQAGGGRKAGIEDRTITATIEMLKGGCLPGDVIPIKVSVQHIKRIKSMHGVIVTLYRQGRIDSAPPLSMFSNVTLSKEDAKLLEKEEYYPKSRTGLGGLSLSSAGSCSVFRKDLSQSFSPLILDPVALSANVKTSIRVPEDVFPSIKGVPGEMISFKYQLEVLVDLGGKLASQIQVSSSSSRGNMGGGGGGQSGGNLFEGGGGPVSSWGTNILDTDRLRREKGVIPVVFEIIVGTLDSNRQRGRGAAPPPPSTQNQHISQVGNENSDIKGPWQNGYEGDGAVILAEYPDEYEPAPPEPTLRYPYWRAPEPPPTSAPFYIPEPELQDEAGLSEKERVRRAEQRLLPSQPPDPAAVGHSGPSLDDDENIYDAEDPPPRRASAGAHPELPHVPAEDAPSAPTLEDLTAGAATPTDDKQELQRQRLLQEASAPPEVPADYDGGARPSSSAPPSAPADLEPSAPAELEPSAPILSDEDGYVWQYSYDTAAGVSSHARSGPAEPLPRYER